MVQLVHPFYWLLVYEIPSSEKHGEIPRKSEHLYHNNYYLIYLSSKTQMCMANK